MIALILKSVKNIVLVCAVLLFVFLIADYLYPLDTNRLSKPLSLQIYGKNGALLRTMLSRDGYWRYRCERDEIPDLLKQSVLEFEDQWFYYHIGVNPVAMLRALVHNATNDNVIGGSTITMQVARMMYHRKRTYGSKFLELFNALQLEWHYTKDEILTYYFNLAPYGGNIEGVKAASHFYFNRALSELSIAQIAILTTIPKNPNANRPDRQKHLYAKRLRVLSLLKKSGIIDASQYRRARLEPVGAKRFSAPMVAPQFTSQFAKREGGTYQSDIELELQRFSRKRLHEAVLRLNALKVQNGAALIIDNRTMAIVAYVGSDNFYQSNGQNDGVAMIRSPGSTLKPFVYAKSLDRGIITPKQEVFDIPIHIGGYAPQNFNKRFMGRISAQEALQYSLNIPAVELNTLLKNDALYELLQRADIASLTHNKSYYGDALVLGGFGVSLLDLVHLYTAFANGGIYKPLNTKDDSQSVRLFSEASAWIVSDILSSGIRPELSAYWDSIEEIPRIGFKTGTSADSRDLLTIGYSKEYTVGVWLGNFDGSKTESLTGINTASKVVFDIFRFLNNSQRLSWLERPQSVKETQLCSDALRLGTCRSEQIDYTIEGVIPKRPCEIMRAEVLAYLLGENAIGSMHDLASHPCYVQWQKNRPLLAAPHEGANFIVNAQNDSDAQKVMLQCYSFKFDQKIFWSIDGGALFEGQSAKEAFVSLEPGTHRIECYDTEASLTTHTITIKVTHETF